MTAAATTTTRPLAGPPRDYRFPFFERVTLDNGLGVIVAPGCVLMAGTPDTTVAAVVKALGGPLKPIPGLKTES